MDSSTADINLIAAKTDVTPSLLVLSAHLQKIGLAATVLSLLLGLFFGVGLTILRVRIKSLNGEKINLLTRIQNNSRKEGLITIIKKQSSVAQKVMATVKPWGDVIAQIASIMPLHIFTSVSVNDKGELSLIISAPTIGDALDVVERINALVKDKSIKNPMLQSLEMGVDGNVRMSLTYISSVSVR